MIYTDRLPGRLPDFTRRIWTSPAAREVWEPRLRQITTAWEAVERLSVAVGVRDAALTSLLPDALPAAAAWAAQHGLVLLPLSTVARQAEYSASARAPAQGEAWEYRVAYVHKDASALWLRAWQASDDVSMGKLLGYPPCCREFFQRVWVDAACVDTTWAMAAPRMSDVQARTIRIEPPYTHASNILMRWLGVRAVPHLPCSFDCTATRDFAMWLKQVGKAHGYDEAFDLLTEVLAWPVEWSALHGIAEIRTPVVKVSARTDLTAGKYVVQVAGPGYPQEGARGVRFPYKSVAEMRQLVQLRGKRNGNGSTGVAVAQANGFTDASAMRTAHAAVIDAGRTMSDPIDTVLDLGCGDGTLVRSISAALNIPHAYGIELNAERAALGHGQDGHILAGDFIAHPELWPGPYDLVVLMPGRLLEVPAAHAQRTRRLLAERAQRVLVYAYGDWLKRSTLHELCAEALPGFVWDEQSLREGVGSAAGVLTVCSVEAARA